MREGARCAVIAKRHALANTKFCRHFVFSRNSDIPGSHLQSQYINIKQISFTLYVRLCRGEQNSSLYYIEETHYSERMIANMSKASALADVRKKRVNPFKELWTNKFLYLLALPAVVYTFILSLIHI